MESSSRMYIQRSEGDVRFESQFVDGHTLHRACHRMAQLQIRREEGIGEGPDIGQGDQGGQKRIGRSDG